MTWTLFGKLVQLLVKERMEYRADFILGGFAQIVNYAGSYLVIWLFLTRFHSIGGWTWPEVALLYSIGLFTYALGASFSFVQMRELENLVRQGTFDGILTKPVNPYLYYICRGFNLAYFAHIMISGAVLLWALGVLHIEWSLFRILYFLAAILSGAMIQAGLISIIGGFAFIWVRTNFMFTLFFRIREFTSYPISIYGSVLQIILVLVVPVAFINFFPSAFLLEKEAPLLGSWGMWIAPLIGPAIFWLGYRFWMICINRYQGAGG
jgi:ABC-2 type transport system permease protein